MEFFKNFLNISSFETKIEEGQFEIYTQLALQINNLEKGENTKYTKQNNKPMPKDVSKHSTDCASKYREITSDILEERGIFRSTAKFTIFGPTSHMVVAGKQNSPSGISPRYLNEKGLINDRMLQNTLFEVCPQVEVVKARMIRMINNWAMCGMYDNATALIFKFLQLYEKLRLDGMTTTQTVPVRITMQMVANADNYDTVIAVLIDYLTEHNIMGVIDKKEPALYEYADQILAWKRTVVRPAADDKGYVNPAAIEKYNAQGTIIHIQAYKCYSYDDGHNKSGKTFFKEGGFINGLTLRPTGMNEYEPDVQDVQYETVKVWGMLEEKAIDRMLKARAYINVDNFSTTEVAILLKVLNKNTRNTPFLIDQTIEIVKPNDRVYLMTNHNHDITSTVFDAKDVLHTLHKLITNHNLYEDARAAYQAALFWTAQPSTETMEAQWWVTMPRMLNLPSFGLSRGAFPCLVNTDGVQITEAALKETQMMCSGTNKIMLYSGVMNALWYWGEYMSIHNTRNEIKKEKLFEFGNCNLLRSHERAIAMVSAMTGLAVPTPVHSNVYTVFSTNNVENYRRVVNFGTIDKTIVDKYGYTTQTDKMVLNTLCAPGATSIVTGLAGELVQGTPYANHFNIEPLQYEITKRGKITRRTNYFNLWAINVVSRWNGYDVSYRPTGAKFDLVSHAANNVSLAVPPMSLVNTDFEYDYEVGSIVQRTHVFGTNILSTVPLHVSYTWVRGSTSTNRTFGFEIYDSDLEEQTYDVTPTYMIQEKGETAKTVALLAKYDYVNSVFQVSQVRIAQPMPTTTDRLALYDIDETQEE
uniref:Coat protein n=1 Tax=Erysiphales associated totivirus 15 TaxID=2719844 RepID=A0A6G9EMD7_9VIRU|nr:coat protein [Erysiphales associated totivirus 15]